MVRFAAVLCLFVAACFNPTFNNPTCGPNGECPSGTTCMNGLCVGGGGDDDGIDAIDAPADVDAVDAAEIIDGSGFAVTFLPASASVPGTDDWIVNVAGNIDTTNLTAMPGFPPGVTFTTSMQTTAGVPEVAVLHVNRLQIAQGAVIRVLGSRPLVIVAGNEVVIDGILDIGGARALPGAGGYASMQGPASGQRGQTDPFFNYDGGGGGGGYGSPGGRGGDGSGGTGQGGPGGSTFGSIPPTSLYGGSGGGEGGENGGCPIPLGGAGGGSLLVASATRIVINGGIRAGGGGGVGGANCGNGPGGGGGGSGGQIELQSPVYAFMPTTFVLAANGGGGGGGGSAAMDGLDGLLSNMPAAGGQPGASGGRGGQGSVFNMPGMDGEVSNNGGGGGGGAGRITVRYRGTQPTVLASPPATFVTY